MVARKRGSKDAAPVLGYLEGFAETFELGKELGKGGNGIVRLGRHRQTGKEYAVKSIPKVLRDPHASERKKASQIPYLKQEVEVLLAMRGTLNVANLEEVYEDASHVHLVLELCRGGELVARAKERHYSERTVASFMRAVLRTLAVCHAKNIIHRDIKPENFLLLSTDDAAPVKTIDFGLATFFDPTALPVTGLNVEGTPWYLAPEACRARWYPATDVWACGIMAAYLLTGRYPFIDKMCPDMPDLARTLRHICFDPLDLSGEPWEGLSKEARAFLTAVLVKDPLQRPSAVEALEHPWLRRGGPSERGTGKPLGGQVVQRLQRFGHSSLFKRTVLQHIAADLVSMHFTAEPSAHGGAVFWDRSMRGGAAYLECSVHGGSVHGGSTHGGLSRSNSMARECSMHGGSAHGGMLSRSARLARERSTHGGSAHGGMLLRGDRGGPPLPSTISLPLPPTPGGGGAALPRRHSRAVSAELPKPQKPGRGVLQRSMSSRESAFAGQGRSGDRSVHGNDRSAHGGDASVRSARAGLQRTHSGVGSEGGSEGRDSTVRGGRSVASMRRMDSGRLSERSLRGGSAFEQLESSVFLPVATPYSQRLAEFLDTLGLQQGAQISQAEMTAALKEFGYRITDEEGAELFGVVDTERQGRLGRAELSAGLIDWKAFQDTYQDRWVECVRRVFHEMDEDGSGTLTAEEIAAAVGTHLSPYEVDAAVHLALLEAVGGAAEGGEEGAPKGIDFDHFLGLLREGDEVLDHFDDRLSNHTSRHATRDLTDAAARALQQKPPPPSKKASKPGGSDGGGAGCCCCVQ